jgi:DNA-binding beta-propeller fold protein YncE
MYDPRPVDRIANPERHYDIINTVTFHPVDDVFCAAFLNNNALLLFEIDAAGKTKLIQRLGNPGADLTSPAHAMFTPSGNKILAVNWSGESFTIYRRNRWGRFSSNAEATMGFPRRLLGYKPHGAEISHSGDLLVMAFGAALHQPKAIALFGLENDGSKISLLGVIEGDGVPGIPKGACFGPDDRTVVVTCSDTNCLVVYGLEAFDDANGGTPRQIYSGEFTQLSRPEDVKLNREQSHLIVSGSGADVVTFHAFDKSTSLILEAPPDTTMRAAESRLSFPHGIAVSPGGNFMVVTQFGPLELTDDEDIVYSNRTPKQLAYINVYRRADATPSMRGVSSEVIAK